MYRLTVCAIAIGDMWVEAYPNSAYMGFSWGPSVLFFILSNMICFVFSKINNLWTYQLPSIWTPCENCSAVCFFLAKRFSTAFFTQKEQVAWYMMDMHVCVVDAICMYTVSLLCACIHSNCFPMPRGSSTGSVIVTVEFPKCGSPLYLSSSM